MKNMTNLSELKCTITYSIEQQLREQRFERVPAFFVRKIKLIT